MTTDHLGEFLYRAARVKNIRNADITKARYYQSSQRPYPGGGACYELEIYPLIKTCEGIDEELYYYQPLKHQLIKISEPNNLTETLIKNAISASDSECSPQILFIIAARFQRLSWKYESIAYSIVLKDAGILLQTMYLTAAAMELAPCAIGCGNSDIFAKTAGLNYYEETSVAEFMIGGKS
ncbi:MAG TPA: SagB family peptide dehydrogenase [bacterium]|nr:SagB family peptide dehydrogenase [bacterium]